MDAIHSQCVTSSGRLASLDILRGFDLFLLVFFQPVLVALGRQADIPLLDPVLYQLDHCVWEGFRFWDLVMPLFLFMSGVAMPFSFAKYKAGTDKFAVYRRIGKRFILLFVLGMAVQGNLLGFDFQHIYFYNNTLQAIASGYLIASVLLLHCNFRKQLIAVSLLLLIYWIPMTFAGDFSPEGNFANRLDAYVLGRFRGDPSYSWIWSSLTFGVTVMLGTFAGQLMKCGNEHRGRTVGRLLLIGVALTGLGWLWGLQMPIIKRIWTCSMTLFSGGICFLLMGVFYYVVDYKGYSYGLNWLKIYGMNSIAAYILGEAVNFRSVAHSVFYGLENHLGAYYSVWLSFVNFFIVFMILRHLYKARIYLKI